MERREGGGEGDREKGVGKRETERGGKEESGLFNLSFSFFTLRSIPHQ